TLTYISPCGVTVSDSFTFALTNDTTLVAWINRDDVPIDSSGVGPFDPFWDRLNDPLVGCPAVIFGMRDSGAAGVNRNTNGLTDGERIFVNTFLIHNSFNDPPSSPNNASYVDHQDYRFYSRLQAYFEQRADGTLDPNTVTYAQQVVNNG